MLNPENFFTCTKDQMLILFKYNLHKPLDMNKFLKKHSGNYEDSSFEVSILEDSILLVLKQQGHLDWRIKVDSNQATWLLLLFTGKVH